MLVIPGIVELPAHGTLVALQGDIGRRVCPGVFRILRQDIDIIGEGSGMRRHGQDQQGENKGKTCPNGTRADIDWLHDVIPRTFSVSFKS